jgi:hypothetical protein
MAKKRRRSVTPEILDYYVQIDAWRPQVGRGVDYSRVWQRPYWEDYGVKIHGRMLAPASVRKFPIRGVAIDVTISGQRTISGIIDRTEEESEDRKPHGVGMVQGLKNRGTPWVILSAPVEHVPVIVTLLCHGKVRFLRWRGNILLRGSANVVSWDLVAALDPDDDPEILPLT